MEIIKPASELKKLVDEKKEQRFNVVLKEIFDKMIVAATLGHTSFSIISKEIEEYVESNKESRTFIELDHLTLAFFGQKFTEKGYHVKDFNWVLRGFRQRCGLVIDWS